MTVKGLPASVESFNRQFFFEGIQFTRKPYLQFPRVAISGMKKVSLIGGKVKSQTYLTTIKEHISSQQ